MIRRLLCVWGEHEWHKVSRECKIDRSGPAVLTFLTAFIAFALGLFFSMCLKSVLLTLSMIAVFMFCIAIYPRVSYYHNGYFDGICIHCHKQVNDYTQEKQRVRQLKQEKKRLTELAEAVYCSDEAILDTNGSTLEE